MLSEPSNGTGAIQSRESQSGPVHMRRVLTEPSAIDELFSQTTNPELADQALKQLLNISGFQSFDVKQEQLAQIMNILATGGSGPVFDKALALLREFTTFRSEGIMNFLCQAENIMIIYNYFPARQAVVILSNCVEYSPTVRTFLLQKFAGDRDSFARILTTTNESTLEPIVVCMSSLFSMCEPSDIMVFYVQKTIEILCGIRDNESMLAFEILRGLVDKLIPSHPGLVDFVAPSLEMIIEACKENEDTIFLLMGLMQAIAEHINGYEFMRVPSISAFVLDCLRDEHPPNDWENMIYASRMLTAADDITGILVPQNAELVPMFICYYNMGTKIAEQKTCAKFLGRCLVYQTQQENRELLNVVTIPMITEWIALADLADNEDTDLKFVLIRALLKIAECSAAFGLNYEDLFLDEQVIQFLDHLQTQPDPLATLGASLAERINNC